MRKLLSLPAVVAGLAGASALAGHDTVAPAASSIQVRAVGHGAANHSDAAPAAGSEGIASSTQTCTASRTGATPMTSAECAAWASSGPVNVVIVVRGSASDPGRDIIAPITGWRPARGRWLVARGFTDGSEGCADGWHDSREQVELRLSSTQRRHFKLIHAECDGELGRGSIVFGEAHTDSYDPIRCSGDHVIDWDQARDALVGALEASGHAASVEYRHGGRAGAALPGGCGRAVASDGRIAYVTLDDGGLSTGARAVPAS